MFITNHVLSGAVIGEALGHDPVGAFVAGVASHLLLDALPHWGCGDMGDDGPEYFLRVARRDGLLGLAAIGVLVATNRNRSQVALLAGIAGAVLLDLDKPIEHFFGVKPFPEVVNRLHGWVQNESPDGMGREVVAGSLLWMAHRALVVASLRRMGRAGPSGRSPAPDPVVPGPPPATAHQAFISW